MNVIEIQKPTKEEMDALKPPNIHEIINRGQNPKKVIVIENIKEQTMKTYDKYLKKMKDQYQDEQFQDQPRNEDQKSERYEGDEPPPPSPPPKKQKTFFSSKEEVRIATKTKMNKLLVNSLAAVAFQNLKKEQEDDKRLKKEVEKKLIRESRKRMLK